MGVLALTSGEPSLPANPGISRPQAITGTQMRSPSSSHPDYLPESGFRYTYTFRRGIVFQGDLAGAKLPPVTYNGEFHIDVLKADSRSFEALLSEHISGAAPSPYLRIEADARGDELRIFTQRLSGEEEKQHLSILKDLAALWLFPLRTDTVGPFEARFEETGPSREKKSKVRYLAKGANVPGIESSQHYVLWNQETHLPAELKGAEATRLGSGTTALVADSRYELLYSRRSRSPAFDLAMLKNLRENESLALDTSKGSMKDHPDYARLDWSALLSQLRSIDKLTDMQQLNLFGDLVKALRLYPGKTGDLASLLKDPSLLKLGASSPLFRNIVGALATFGSTEAQAALRDAYNDPALADSGRSTILAAFTTTQAPLDSTTREFLAAKMDSEKDARLSSAAAFALGSALQNAATDSQARSAIEKITDRWAGATSTTDKLTMLDVMGNSGREEFEGTLRNVVHGDSELMIRERALYGLRFVKTASATAELVQGLAAPERELREAAASAIEIAEWSESFRAPLERCSSAETNVAVATSCRKSLSNNARVADSQ